MKGLGALAELEARVVVLETDAIVLRSILDDLETNALPGTGGPPIPPAPPPSRRDEGNPEPNDEPVSPFYDSLLEFVNDGFAPVFCRTTSPTMRWCASWWDHAEAIYRLEALWRTWELYRLEPRLGIASWLRDYLDPQLHALTSPTGPFAQCTDDRHTPARPLRTAQPPAHYFAYL